MGAPSGERVPTPARERALTPLVPFEGDLQDATLVRRDDGMPALSPTERTEALLEGILHAVAHPAPAPTIYEYVVVTSQAGQASCSGEGVQGEVNIPQQGAAAILLGALGQHGYRVVGNVATAHQAIWTMERAHVQGRAPLTREVLLRGRQR